MGVKSLILDRNERVLHVERDLVELDIYTVGILGNKLSQLIAFAVINGRRIARRRNIHVRNIGSRVNDTHEQSHADAQSGHSDADSTKRGEHEYAHPEELADLRRRRIHRLLAFFDPSSSVVHISSTKLLLYQIIRLSAIRMSIRRANHTSGIRLLCSRECSRYIPVCQREGLPSSYRSR